MRGDGRRASACGHGRRVYAVVHLHMGGVGCCCMMHIVCGGGKQGGRRGRGGGGHFVFLTPSGHCKKKQQRQCRGSFPAPLPPHHHGDAAHNLARTPDFGWEVGGVPHQHLGVASLTCMHTIWRAAISTWPAGRPAAALHHTTSGLWHPLCACRAVALAGSLSAIHICMSRCCSTKYTPAPATTRPPAHTHNLPPPSL